jgi:hypothetical protein
MLLGRLTIGTIGIMGGVPVVPTEFAKCLCNLQEFNRTNLLAPNEEIKTVWATVSTHAIARNSLVEQREGDWLFMLDTDMTFEPDTLARLLRVAEETQTDVVCGVYHFGSPPYLPVMYAWVEALGNYQQLVKWEDSGPFAIGASGGGCLLVKSTVFDRIGGNPFAVAPPFATDDFPFFEKCRVAGITCACDPRVKCGHLRMVPIGEEQYRGAVGDVAAIRLEA